MNPKQVNILFPHWGYELETYPRPEIVHLAKTYAREFDAILGHHPHTVQPFTTDRLRYGNRPIAYSLGDFCSNIPFKAYQLRCERPALADLSGAKEEMSVN